jgi:phosphate:Na+ symporter
MFVLLILAGAVCLLLWGVRMVQTGIQRLLGSRLERYLRRSTGHRLTAFVTGGSSAFLLQSSTAVILMLAGFSSSGMLGLPAALAAVLGAEFGASIAALLLNLDIQKLALPLILIGYIVHRKNRSRGGKHSGRLIIGLGFVLLALGLIGDITEDVGNSEIFLVVSGYVESDEALAMTLMGVLTWVIHSTLAAVLIIGRFVQDSTISMEVGIFLLLGANVGGAIPAFVAGWGFPGNGRQVVLGNLIFRISAVGLGVLLMVFLGDQIVDWLPSNAMGIVIVHCVLNLLNGLLLLSVLSFIEPAFRRKFNPADVTSFNQDKDNPIYLAVDDINNPRRAIANVRNEALHIADIVYRMLNHSFDAFSDLELGKQISSLDEDIDRLHREALNYVVSIGDANKEGIGGESHEIITYMTNLEHIGDIIQSSLMNSARNKLNNEAQFDSIQTAVIEKLHEELVDAFRLSQAVFTSDSLSLAKELIGFKRKYRSAIFKARFDHLDHLTGHHSENLIMTQILLDVLRDMQRICSHLTSIAYLVVDRKENDVIVSANTEESSL